MSFPVDYDDCQEIEQITTIDDLIDYSRIQSIVNLHTATDTELEWTQGIQGAIHIYWENVCDFSGSYIRSGTSDSFSPFPGSFSNNGNDTYTLYHAFTVPGEYTAKITDSESGLYLLIKIVVAPMDENSGIITLGNGWRAIF